MRTAFRIKNCLLREELQELGKPFAVLLNCLDPHTAAAKAMAEQLSQQYQAPVLPVSCPDLDENDICQILTELLRVFPVREINVCMPRWKKATGCGNRSFPVSGRLPQRSTPFGIRLFSPRQ